MQTKCCKDPDYPCDICAQVMLDDVEHEIKCLKRELDELKRVLEGIDYEYR